MRVGINGMGRMGRLALRAALGGVRRADGDPRGENRLDVVHLNEVKGGAAATAHLLEFDSTHGRWRAAFGVEDDAKIRIDNKSLGFSAAAPVKDDSALNIVVGVNDRLYDPGRHRLLTAASCTTNCLAPVVKVIHESIGIRHGQITTIHDPTNTNVVVDAPHRDLRRARSAMLSLQPTTTGSATAISLIYPELKGKLDGHAVRAPVLNASLTDCVFELARPTTVEEVNRLFKSASESVLAGILGLEARALVSADYNNDPRSSIVDALSTMVTDETLLKIYAWYDNEVGYA